MRFQRFLAFLAMCFGFVGIVVCVAGIAGVCAVGSRVARANEHVFAAIDKSLSTVHARVLSAQGRVRDLKITTEEIRQTVKDWAQNETGERLATRLQIEQKAVQLARGIEQLDQWMELSAASMQGLKQALELGSSIGAPLDPAFFDPLLTRVETLRSQLSEVTGTVDGIRERAVALAAGKPFEERRNQAAQLAVRVLATFGQIDTRLGELAQQFSQTKMTAQRLHSRTHMAILVAQVAAILVLLWMAAGQVCLCLRCRRTPGGILGRLTI